MLAPPAASLARALGQGGCRVGVLGFGRSGRASGGSWGTAHLARSGAPPLRKSSQAGEGEGGGTPGAAPGLRGEAARGLETRARILSTDYWPDFGPCEPRGAFCSGSAAARCGGGQRAGQQHQARTGRSSSARAATGSAIQRPSGGRAERAGRRSRCLRPWEQAKAGVKLRTGGGLSALLLGDERLVVL